MYGRGKGCGSYGNTDVKEVNRGGGNKIGKFNSWMETTNKVYEIVEVIKRNIGNSKTIIYITTEYVRDRALKSGKDKMFKVTHK